MADHDKPDTSSTQHVAISQYIPSFEDKNANLSGHVQPARHDSKYEVILPETQIDS
jgi:hypothetical protein